MKKIIIALVLLCSGMTLQAQDVYNEILRIATEKAENTNNPMEVRLMNVFQVDALQYMLQRTCEQMPDASVNVLNEQSLAMFEFITEFSKQLTLAAKGKERELVINRFKNASLYHKRFNDQDKALCEAYIGKEKYLTQFSLDTDWEQALAEIRKFYKE